MFFLEHTVKNLAKEADYEEKTSLWDYFSLIYDDFFSRSAMNLKSRIFL